MAQLSLRIPDSLRSHLEAVAKATNQDLSVVIRAYIVKSLRECSLTPEDLAKGRRESIMKG